MSRSTLVASFRLIVVYQANFAGFVASALALKLRNKVLNTNLSTYQNWLDKLLVAHQTNFAGFVVNALALKLRTKVLATNLFTHQSCFEKVLVSDSGVLYEEGEGGKVKTSPEVKRPVHPFPLSPLPFNLFPFIWKPYLLF
jgi:hypothetical protein